MKTAVASLAGAALLLLACDPRRGRPPTPIPAPTPTAPPPAARTQDDGATFAAFDASGAPLAVPYVTTPIEIVDKMLALGRVDADDLLYDLGSGDGRIVIRAAQKFGARGIGFDLDPARIRESTELARTAGVSDLVQFIEQDFFTVDLRPATVVTMYLLPEINERLKPKLLAELRPGTRVVSHNYGMDGWAHEALAEFKIAGETHYATVWAMPPPTTPAPAP